MGTTTAIDEAATSASELRPRRVRSRGISRQLDGWSDSDLVRAVLAGSKDASDALYSRHDTIVRFVVRDNVRDPDDIDDVVQEIFGRAFARLDTLQKPERFRAWLLQISRRAAIDSRRSRTRRPESRSIDDHVVIDLTPGPALLAEVRDLADTVGHGISGLSARDRQVLTMVIELGFSTDDVAAALDLSPGAAKVVLHRARKRLRLAVSSSLEPASLVRTAP